MKNYFELNKEERLASLEERKKEPRPEHFVKEQPEVIEVEVPVEETPVVEEPVVTPKKSKKSKK